MIFYDGKLLFDNNQIAFNEDCCCLPLGNVIEWVNCNKCTGDAPSQLLVEIGGLRDNDCVECESRLNGQHILDVSLCNGDPDDHCCYYKPFDPLICNDCEPGSPIRSLSGITVWWIGWKIKIEIDAYASLVNYLVFEKNFGGATDCNWDEEDIPLVYEYPPFNCYQGGFPSWWTMCKDTPGGITCHITAY